ncbi:hypothetical protein H6G04_13460 [Calothrix membranacea FACHB-236]|nr:hypothetical protein [Calothrix membranacea FACHB-236]
MSENIQQAQELSTEELDNVAGGLIDVTQFTDVDTNFEAVKSGAAAAPGLAVTDGTAINDETRQIAFRRDLVI